MGTDIDEEMLLSVRRMRLTLPTKCGGFGPNAAYLILSRESLCEPNLSSLIAAAEKGDRSVTGALFAALYSELHRRAKRELDRQGAPVSLSPTTLLHQAYLDMADREGSSFPDQARFMGYAVRVMRGLIIDHARNHHAQKRGGLIEITSFGTEASDKSVDHRELSQSVRRSTNWPRWTRRWPRSST